MAFAPALLLADVIASGKSTPGVTARIATAVRTACSRHRARLRLLERDGEPPMTKVLLATLLLVGVCAATEADERRPRAGGIQDLIERPDNDVSAPAPRGPRAGGPVSAAKFSSAATGANPCGRKYCRGAVAAERVAGTPDPD